MEHVRPGRSALAVAAAAALAATAMSCGAAPHDSSPGPLEAAATDTAGAAQPRADETVEFSDVEVAISGRLPAGWHHARALSGLVEPREVLALASFPLRGGAEAGECAPSTAREDLPRDGVFIWLLEYRPLRGDVWADLPRDRFPPRARRFDLGVDDLHENLSCFLGPGYSATFRAADRPFQLLVAFGGLPSAERLEEVNRTLDSLSFGELPPPAPDPYAAWPLLNDNPGDSLRVPPGWAAAAATFRLGDVLRPRPLFFAANVGLPELPRTLVPHVDALPAPFPSAALASFPADGVLLWVLEEERGGTSPEFPPVEEGWTGRAAFRAVSSAVAPELRWQRAGGSFRGYRFSLWIAAGNVATDEDLELAFESAVSLAVSGCFRDAVEDCPDR